MWRWEGDFSLHAIFDRSAGRGGAEEQFPACARPANLETLKFSSLIKLPRAQGLDLKPSLAKQHALRALSLQCLVPATTAIAGLYLW